MITFSNLKYLFLPLKHRFLSIIFDTFCRSQSSVPLEFSTVRLLWCLLQLLFSIGFKGMWQHILILPLSKCSTFALHLFFQVTNYKIMWNFFYSQIFYLRFCLDLLTFASLWLIVLWRPYTKETLGHEHELEWLEMYASTFPYLQLSARKLGQTRDSPFLFAHFDQHTITIWSFG